MIASPQSTIRPLKIHLYNTKNDKQKVSCVAKVRGWDIIVWLQAPKDMDSLHAFKPLKLQMKPHMEIMMSVAMDVNVSVDWLRADSFTLKQLTAVSKPVWTNAHKSNNILAKLWSPAITDIPHDVCANVVIMGGFRLSRQNLSFNPWKAWWFRG